LSRALLDVNFLLALFDDKHIAYEAAHEWFALNQANGWATCGVTENGFVRIISTPSYSQRITVKDAIEALHETTMTDECERWSDDVSILDPSAFDRSRLHSHRQITDAYLLALAVRHGGRLVTFDRSIPLSAVAGAEARHLVVL
jgi:uncharacterized protein